MSDTTIGGCFEAKPTWLDRLRWRLFPRPPRPLITNDPRTFLTTEIHTRVDWLDRLRVLITGRVRVTTLTYTDVEVKDAESRSVFWVE